MSPLLHLSHLDTLAPRRIATGLGHIVHLSRQTLQVHTFSWLLRERKKRIYQARVCERWELKRVKNNAVKTCWSEIVHLIQIPAIIL